MKTAADSILLICRNRERLNATAVCAGDPSTRCILGANSDELALAGKAPPDAGKTLKSSPGARAFFRSATDLALSEDEWKELLEKLKRGKEKEK
jgi:hypothetical protein